MAINVSFNGATIYKPGAYSKVTIDLGGAFPLGPTGLIGIIGESTRGKPGSAEQDIGDNVYTAAQVPEIIEKYGTGNIVDACNFLFSPASDGAIPNGAQGIYIYKTNASVQASLALDNSYGTIKSIVYGESGNRIYYTCSHTDEVAPVIQGIDYVPNAADAGISFTAYLNGAKQVITVAAGTYANAAALAAAITITGMTVSTSGEKIVLTVTADSTAYRRGYGKSLELEDSTPGDLAKAGLSEDFETSSVEAAATLKVDQRAELLTEEDTIGGNVVLLGRYTGAGTAASITVDKANDRLRLTVDAANEDFKLSAYSTLSELVADINAEAGWVFSLSSTLYNQLSVLALESVTMSALTGASNTPIRIKKDWYEFREFMTASSLVIHDIASVTPTLIGLPEVRTARKLAGGEVGATSSASITNALLAFEGIRLNGVLPLFSRDASEDILDGLTDTSSSYTIAAIHQGVKSHLSKMASTKQKSERQGYLSYKGYFSSNSVGYSSGDTCCDVAQNLAYGRIQLAIQDVRNTDSEGNIKWFQPWAFACNIAGARSGSPIGTPLTNKYINIAGTRHTPQPMRTAEADIVTDFDPRTQYEQAIQNGITFMEIPQSGGFKIVVDNTTYGRDGNWVWNRGNVIYAADILAFDFRDQLEKIYVGVKNTINAAEVKSTCESILATYLAQGITVQSDDAPNGFKSLVVRIEGSTIYISVTVKLVEGIDFVLADITLQRKVSNA